jgi:anti-sigma B factor antagonist
MAPFELLTITSAPSPDGVILRVHGEVDLETAPRLRAELARHLHTGVVVSLHLGDVTFMDSSGLHVLLASLRRASLVGSELRLVEVSRRVQRLLEITGTAQVLQRPSHPAPRPFTEAEGNIRRAAEASAG